ncbi:PD-(D/E)XK motif protein [Humibacter ginsengisoli]
MADVPLKSSYEQVLGSPSGRMVVIRQAPFMFAAVNDGGRAALFVRASLSPSQVLSDGHGFSVRTTRSGKDDYVQITAADRGLPPLFLKLVEYILERVAQSATADEGSEQLIRSIDEFRRFVGQRRGRLPESLVRGTFAELIFLNALLSIGVDVESAVSAWRGPWAKAGLGVHDFTFANGRGIEVKSTRQPPQTIRVSSPTQLVPTEQPLDLVVLPIEEATDESSNAIQFRQYMRQTADAIATAGTSPAEKWTAALEALGLDLSDEWYDKYRFIPGNWRRYTIRDDFPHLDISQAPAGIIDVHYSLELSRLLPFAAPFNHLLNEIKS